MKPGISTRISTVLIVSGALSLLLFHQAGSYVDAQGILREPFALLGGGYILLGSGLLIALVKLVRRWLHMQ
ncbi:MAG: DUF3955 domain-containing protein [Amphritea sp.]|nr:DUF3955 domain-containing protein [Amphritea sp.]